MSILDHTVEITCPNPDCVEKKLHIRFRDLSAGNVVECPSCKARIRLNVTDNDGRPSDPAAAMRRLQNALDDLGARETSSPPSSKRVAEVVERTPPSRGEAD